VNFDGTPAEGGNGIGNEICGISERRNMKSGGFAQRTEEMTAEREAEKTEDWLRVSHGTLVWRTEEGETEEGGVTYR
jgi:hypothetical protein